MKLLLDAWDYAQDVKLDVWDFAVELDVLRNAGLGTSDLRWLLCKGYVRHAVEIPAERQDSRMFRPLGRLTVTDKTCFVLTEFGQQAAVSASAPQRMIPKHSNIRAGAKAVETEPSCVVFPRWDRDSRELSVGKALVKRFRVPAENQELVLAAFEEDGWPPFIDDPLSPLPGLDCKRRLHDTINRLNRNQKQPLIRFRGHGNGCMVRWEATD